MAVPARVFFSRMLCRRCRIHAAGAVPRIPVSYGMQHLSCYSSSISSPALSPEPTCETSSGQQRDWRIVAAACVQRMPTLSREKSELELKYEEMREQVKMEKSKLSDFELEEREFESMKKARIKKAQEENTDVKGLSDKTDEFEDMLESREMELQEFEPAPRLTEPDRIGDMRSLDRQLDRVLYLLVKKPREEHAWQMPQGGVEGEESLVEAAKRELSEECGSSVQVNFYSNTPSAVLSYKHPPSPHDQHSSLGSVKSELFSFMTVVHKLEPSLHEIHQTDPLAAKRELSEECGSSVQVNFYSNTPSAVLSYKHPPSPHDQHSSLGSKAFYQNGTPELNKEELMDHAWVTKKEMKDYVSQEYYQAVEPILTD